MAVAAVNNLWKFRVTIHTIFQPDCATIQPNSKCAII